MKLAMLVFVVILMATGMWLQGAANGYEHGKADALQSLRTHGIVVIYPNGTCSIYDKPGDKIVVSNVASYGNLVFLVRTK